ncbi:hypothetical protein C5B37_13120, partial [Neisseria gonorrhoeae]
MCIRDRSENVETLLAAYRFLRDVEHRLQYWDDQQTQTLPISAIFFSVSCVPFSCSARIWPPVSYKHLEKTKNTYNSNRLSALAQRMGKRSI